MNPQPSFYQHLAAWKWAVAGQKSAPWPNELVAASQEEFTLWSNQLAQAKVDANKAGYTCQFNKGSKPGRSAAWVASNGHTLKVVFAAKAKRAQEVTATSREAYHSLDFTTQRGQIAQAIFEQTMALADNEGVTRKELEVWYKFQTNAVCGRVKELLEISQNTPVVFHNRKPYRLQVVSTRLSKCDGASNVPNEALRWVEVSGANQGQTSLFQ